MTVRPSLLSLAVMLMPVAAGAHPHVFIDAALQGRRVGHEQIVADKLNALTKGDG